MELQPIPAGVRPNVEHALQTKEATAAPSPLLLLVGLGCVLLVAVLAIRWYRRKRR